jgi:hypothetical protein
MRAAIMAAQGNSDAHVRNNAEISMTRGVHTLQFQSTLVTLSL